MNLTSLKLLLFVLFQNSRNSDRQDYFLETDFAFFQIRKHSNIPHVPTNRVSIALDMAVRIILFSR